MKQQLKTQRTKKMLRDKQGQALNDLMAELYDWNSPSCMHGNGDCECRHKNLFGSTHLAEVGEWVRGRDSTVQDGDGFMAFYEQDNYHQWRSNLRLGFPPEEKDGKQVVEGTTHYGVELIPTRLLKHEDSCFGVVEPLYSEKEATKIVRKAKSILRAWEKQNGIDIDMKNLEVSFIKNNCYSDGTHRSFGLSLIFWFDSN